MRYSKENFLNRQENYFFFNFVLSVNLDKLGELQEEFIGLASNLQLKVIFSEGGYEKFWLQEKLRQEYPNIWKEVRLFL